MKSQEDTNENTNEIAGSRPISASVGQQTEVGSVERVENPSTPFLSVWMLRYGVPGQAAAEFL